jgi:RimJ/RimL family protein N-acetyltransferase
MTEHLNHLGQPIGVPVDGWAARQRPPRTPMTGRFCRVELLDAARHAAELYAANSEDRDGRMWTYLPWGPYDGFDDYLAAIEGGLRREDFITFAVIDTASGKAVGVASYLNINPTAGSIEVGGIAYSPALQRKPAGTEAIYLMMRRVFDALGYRRYEWKCNALNAPSPSDTASGSREFSARPKSSRAAIATPPGSRSSTANGRGSRRRSSAGSTRRISMMTAASG